MRLSGNSQAVEDPFDLAVWSTFSVVVADEQLVGEQRCQQLGAIVVEAAVPDFVIQLEQILEPIVERFHRQAAARRVCDREGISRTSFGPSVERDVRRAAWAADRLAAVSGQSKAASGAE